MDEAGRATDRDEGAALAAQAALLQAKQAFGRSPALERLFAFLLECSLAGRSPKETEIADRVFGRGADESDQDASVRVYAHRLRRKLDDFYTGAGRGEAVRLTIPKGAYRLNVEPLPARGDEAPVQVPVPTAGSAPPAARRFRLVELLGIVLLLAATSALTWALTRGSDPVDAPLALVRANPLWGPTVTNGRKVVIVVGDYYIFGETDEMGDVTRLVREFDVNSPADLKRLAASRPERAANYVDLGLDYLPVGVASALRLVVPIVRRNEREMLKPLVVPVSAVGADQLKTANIVYLGYLSGLGSLRDPVFSGSRFTVGGSYDEIVDRVTGRRYTGGTHLDANDARPSEDYALVSTFAGVAGNRVVVIAGTRDAALMQAAEFVTRPESVALITQRLHGAPAFDSLLAVESLHDVGLRARLVAVSPRVRDPDWSGYPTQTFPDEMGTATSPRR